MRTVLPPPPPPTVAVDGDDARFPVRRVFCVGRNYAAHAREMGHDPTREPPFFFSKPADAVLDAGLAADARLPYPPATASLHHEVELVVALGAGGTALDLAEAARCVWGYAVGLDLTRRDLQHEAKAAGRPWDMAKGFDRSAPIAPLRRGPTPPNGALWLTVDGYERQRASTDDLIWPVPELLAALSRYVELAAGDLVFTGTPAGVGPLTVGQRVRAGVADLPELALTVVDGVPPR